MRKRRGLGGAACQPMSTGNPIEIAGERFWASAARLPSGQNLSRPIADERPLSDLRPRLRARAGLFPRGYVHQLPAVGDRDQIDVVAIHLARPEMRLEWAVLWTVPVLIVFVPAIVRWSRVLWMYWYLPSNKRQATLRPGPRRRRPANVPTSKWHRSCIVNCRDVCRAEVSTMTHTEPDLTRTESVQINVGGVALIGDLTVPPAACGVVLLAHGSGSSRHSPRNRFVAGELNKVGWERSFSICSRLTKRLSMSAPRNIDLTSCFWRDGWSRQSTGSAIFRRPLASPLVYSGPERRPARHWRRQRGGRPARAWLSVAAAGPILPPMTCRVLAHRHF